MTDHVSANAARMKRKQDEAAPQGQRSARQKKFERDLAALEALLAEDLHHAKSPPIAANDEHDQPQAPELESPKARLKPPSRSRAAKKSAEPRRARRAPPPAENFNDAPMPRVDRGEWMRAFESELLREEDEPAFSRMHPVDLDEYAAGRTEPVFEARAPRPTPERNPLNAGERFYVKPGDRRGPITRALRIGATVFSLLALVGVSALLVLLAAGGGERSMTPATTSLPESARQTAANENAAPAALPVENDDVLVTGSADTKADGRIAAESQPLPRGGGTVRAVAAGETAAQPQQAAGNAPLTAPEADADRAMLAAEPAVAPQAGSQPAEAAAEPASPPPAEQTDAPAAVASLEPRAGTEAAAARTAPVTTHVNMRASPDNEGKVVAVVPAGKDVGVIECKQWCEVSYNDQQGYIHKRFLKE